MAEPSTTLAQVTQELQMAIDLIGRYDVPDPEPEPEEADPNEFSWYNKRLSLYYNRRGQPVSVEVFAAMMRDMEYRRVALTHLRGCAVSTVLLGIDHGYNPNGPPIIFETMVRGGEYDGYMWRSATEEQARVMHEVGIIFVRSKPFRRVEFARDQRIARARKARSTEPRGPLQKKPRQGGRRIKMQAADRFWAKDAWL